jgi:exopolysaccharide biosynthesis polyprenyl glycosylphosphotransferase
MTEGVRAREGLALADAFGVVGPFRERPMVPGSWWPIVDGVLAVGILAAVVIAGNLNGGRMPNGLEEFLEIRVTLMNVLLLTAFGLVWPTVLSACGLYSPARLRTGLDDWPRLLLASSIGCLMAMVFVVTSRSGAVRPEHALIFATLVMLSTGLLRQTVRTLQQARQGTHRRQVVLVGSGPRAARLYRELQHDRLRANEVIGFVDSEPHPALRDSGATYLGTEEDLERILMGSVVDDVIIGLPIKSRYASIHRSIAACERVGVPAKYPGDLFHDASSNPRNGHTTPLLSVLREPDGSSRAVKRCIDVVGAAMILVALAPVMVAVALVIKVTSRGPVLFVQKRYGYMKRRFRMYKFRTMVVDAEQLQAGLEHRNEATGPVFKIRDDPRLTRVGRFLRRTSLDELPQLWHVLTGEMSLVGPRPMAVRDVSLFTEPWLMKRFSVRPGLTCLWQISGRSSLGFEQWIALDLEYIQRWSLWLDLKILLLTIPAVVSGRGAA